MKNRFLVGKMPFVLLCVASSQVLACAAESSETEPRVQQKSADPTTAVVQRGMLVSAQNTAPASSSRQVTFSFSEPALYVLPGIFEITNLSADGSSFDAKLVGQTGKPTVVSEYLSNSTNLRQSNLKRIRETVAGGLPIFSIYRDENQFPLGVADCAEGLRNGCYTPGLAVKPGLLVGQQNTSGLIENPTFQVGTSDNLLNYVHLSTIDLDTVACDAVRVISETTFIESILGGAQFPMTNDLCQ